MRTDGRSHDYSLTMHRHGLCMRGKGRSVASRHARAGGASARNHDRGDVPECALEREGVANQARPITQDQIGGVLTNFVNIWLSIIGFFFG